MQPRTSVVTNDRTVIESSLARSKVLFLHVRVDTSRTRSSHSKFQGCRVCAHQIVRRAIEVLVNHSLPATIQRVAVLTCHMSTARPNLAIKIYNISLTSFQSIRVLIRTKSSWEVFCLTFLTDLVQNRHYLCFPPQLRVFC